MNAYWINREEKVFDYPMEFSPERWTQGRTGRVDGAPLQGVDKAGMPHFGFGVGRRMCAGADCKPLLVELLSIAATDGASFCSG